MNWLTDILALIEKIPSTFWGIVVGSFFSLGGIVISNRSNDRRLRQQLKHDRKIKNHERELSLKKDIYLGVAEAISTGINSLGSFANLDIPHDKLTASYIEKSSSIAKAHVIAKENTAATIAKLTGELNAAYLRLFAKRIPLVALKQRATLLEGQMEAFARERDHMVELMKQHNLDGANDQRKWDVINGNFQFEQQRITDTAKEHSELTTALYSKQLEFMQDCINETTRLSRVLIPALIAVRAELELPIDQASYTAVIEESILHQETALSEFIQQVQPSEISKSSA